MNEQAFIERSLATNASTLADQYANGTAAQVWNDFIGDRHARTRHYKDRLVSILKENGCRRVLDVATGTGVDSITLCEEGFLVTSIDASDKMLKEALKVRWERRDEKGFNSWVIMEANWLTLAEDLSKIVGEGFDAVICIGNSFPHMPDFAGDGKIQRQALENFEKVVKPGGMLIIDHRNYDRILDFGAAPTKCIYYNSNCESDIKTSILYVDGVPKLVTLDYYVNPTKTKKCKKENGTNGEISLLEADNKKDNKVKHFHLACFPHRYKSFGNLLVGVFGARAKHRILGDWVELGDIPEDDPPGFYVHVVEKPALQNGTNGTSRR